jgi:hypothetical protein
VVNIARNPLLRATVEYGRRSTGDDAEAEVAAALAGLDRMAEIAAAAQDLGSVGQLFQRLNARLFLRFTEAQWKKRTVNKLASGIVAFGATPAPVPI